jgi:hypothetical protein
MDIFYALIITVCFIMLGSSKINTDTALKILGIGLILAGALIHLRHDNPLMELGILSYLICDCLNAFFSKPTKRKTDRVTR